MGKIRLLNFYFDLFQTIYGDVATLTRNKTNFIARFSNSSILICSTFPQTGLSLVLLPPRIYRATIRIGTDASTGQPIHLLSYESQETLTQTHSSEHLKLATVSNSKCLICGKKYPTVEGSVFGEVFKKLRNRIAKLMNKYFRLDVDEDLLMNFARDWYINPNLSVMERRLILSIENENERNYYFHKLYEQGLFHYFDTLIHLKETLDYYEFSTIGPTIHIDQKFNELQIGDLQIAIIITHLDEFKNNYLNNFRGVRSGIFDDFSGFWLEFPTSLTVVRVSCKPKNTLTPRKLNNTIRSNNSSHFDDLDE